ncbi:HAD family hydrolase [Candidatus Bathyarchaeota archaeon]|nr:HAD family hydrolase [Candidatus Bathyarchaeota archaeon]
MKPSIKAITFDLWNTIYVEKSYKADRIKKFSSILLTENSYVNEEKILEVYDKATEEYEKYWINECKHYQNSERLDFMLKLLEIKLSNHKKKEVLDVFTDVFLANPPDFKSNVISTIQKLAEKFRLGIISDTGVTPGKVIRQHLENQGVLKYFQSTIFSDEVGYCKPHHTPFKFALSQLNVKAEEVIHVGDLLRTDVLGAKNRGMLAVWIKEREQSQKGVSPDYIITDISEVLKIYEINSVLNH